MNRVDLESFPIKCRALPNRVATLLLPIQMGGRVRKTDQKRISASQTTIPRNNLSGRIWRPCNPAQFLRRARDAKNLKWTSHPNQQHSTARSRDNCRCNQPIERFGPCNHPTISEGHRSAPSKPGRATEYATLQPPHNRSFPHGSRFAVSMWCDRRMVGVVIVCNFPMVDLRLELLQRSVHDSHPRSFPTTSFPNLSRWIFILGKDSQALYGALTIMFHLKTIHTSSIRSSLEWVGKHPSRWGIDPRPTSRLGRFHRCPTNVTGKGKIGNGQTLIIHLPMTWSVLYIRLLSNGCSVCSSPWPSFHNSFSIMIR